jgi:hypothetical protein
MASQITGKAKVFLALAALAAAGLFAAGLPPRESSVDIAPTAGLPALRGVDAVPAPRECDLQREIDSACTFL